MGEKYIQQDDNYREFMNNITDGGLQYAYHTWIKGESAKEYYRQKVTDDKKRHVIIVGAGMSGLAAGYELAQVGHKVRYEPPRGKTNKVVSEQVRHKPTCTSTERS